ncbi:uncharacterized protein LOC112501236 [Cynara cardunculus var. scolymus]|uniref:uncharacterized protein LOC112501236 n=1 Tax=Cynara cardunculus var. scolymus TaxID=59895 RepID=UPI000D62BA4C|nr:uncharacterized protein LOC112501236 [Cynara cardunculus var. scolymus]
MNRRIRKHSVAKKSDNGYLRYLRPGALAQLRDSKINARSHLRSYGSQISIHRAVPSSPTSSPSRSLSAFSVIQQQQQDVTGTFTTTDGEIPFIFARFYEPRCPQRKKLMAAKSMFCPSHNSNGLISDGPEPVVDVFSNDILVAH